MIEHNPLRLKAQGQAVRDFWWKLGGSGRGGCTLSPKGHTRADLRTNGSAEFLDEAALECPEVSTHRTAWTSPLGHTSQSSVCSWFLSELWAHRVRRDASGHRTLDPEWSGGYSFPYCLGMTVIPQNHTWKTLHG